MIDFALLQEWFWNWVFNYVLSLGVTVAIYVGFKKWKWGGWKVVVIDRDGVQHKPRNISVKKREEIEDDSEMSVFLKGVCSPYIQFQNYDLITDGEKDGLLLKDKRQRIITVDLRKYPSTKIQQEIASP